MVPPFLVDASMITEFQSCRRKFLLSRKWRPLRWKLKMLSDSCLRQGIVELGNGIPIEDVISNATTRLMNTGASPGLDVNGHDPYRMALDACAMLETILTTLSRRPLEKLTPVPSKQIADGVEWVFLAHQDERGELHRTITVDRLDDDRLSQELHSWYVFGDVSVAKKPMHLHVIEIGQMRDGRRHSPWVRAWQHEYIANRIKFQRKGGKDLQGDAWKPVFLADSNTWKSSAWVDAMENEGVADTLLKEISVDVPRTDHIKACIRDIKVESQQMQEWLGSVLNPMAVPMSRAACDVPFTCQFQAACMNPIVDIDIESLGIFKPRTTK